MVMGAVAIEGETGTTQGVEGMVGGESPLSPTLRDRTDHGRDHIVT